MTPFQKKLVLCLLVMALLSPLGILIPEHFKAGDAWGEWSLETIEQMIGFRPAGMERDAGLWKAPVPDYNLGTNASPPGIKAVSYILSGLAGLSICLLLGYAAMRALKKNKGGK